VTLTICEILRDLQIGISPTWIPRRRTFPCAAARLHHRRRTSDPPLSINLSPRTRRPPLPNTRFLFDRPRETRLPLDPPQTHAQVDSHRELGCGCYTHRNEGDQESIEGSRWESREMDQIRTRSFDRRYWSYLYVFSLCCSQPAGSTESREKIVQS